MNGLDALWAFLVAGAVTLLLTPLAARLAHRVGAIDQPRERSLHEFPTPSLGGLAILAGVLVAGLLFLPFNTETKGILGGAVLIALVGAVDDASRRRHVARCPSCSASWPRPASWWPATCASRT